MSFSISGHILSLCLDRSARFRHDKILGIYCGFARPTCARAFTHCLAVIGFSSAICVRNSDIMASKWFSSSHCAFAARIYNTRFLTTNTPLAVIEILYIPIIATYRSVVNSKHEKLRMSQEQSKFPMNFLRPDLFHLAKSIRRIFTFLAWKIYCSNCECATCSIMSCVIDSTMRIGDRQTRTYIQQLR